MRTPLFVAILVVFVGLFAWFLLGRPTNPEENSRPVACTMEALICPDGTAVGRTGPNCEFAPCPDIPEPVTDDLIVIDSPAPGATVTSPVTVSGKARGNWFFEASFPITIVNWDGLIIGEGIATAQGEWMTTEFVPFTGTISYTFDPETPYNRGAIIFKKDNPSGLPENDDAREIPIIFGGSDVGMEFPSVPPESNGPISTPTPNEPVVCTMDAQMCPDGSYVGRVPPSCAFAPCPIN